MADKKKDEEEVKEEPVKKGPLKLIIIIVVALVVLGGGGFFAWSKFSKSDVETEGEKVTEKVAGKVVEEVEKPIGFLKLEPFVVNLSEDVGTTYLKLTIVLEMDDTKSVSGAEMMMPKMRDAIIVLLSSKRFDEIGTVDGKYQLREEIVARVNHILSGNKVKTAYFTEFIIQ